MTTLTFAGCKGAFAEEAFDGKSYQSIALLEGMCPTNGVDSMLLDCGGDVRLALRDLRDFGRPAPTITQLKSVYVTHLHGDHVGGLEWLAFKAFFSKHRPTMFISSDMAGDLWSSCLRGGLESLQAGLVEDESADLSTYFQVKKIRPNGSFKTCGCTCRPVQMTHVVNFFRHNPAYGLFIQHDQSGVKTLFTGDTQFAPNQLADYYNLADVIFHDCETAPYKSKVHANYVDLNTLPAEIKQKMWLYHYNDGPLPDAVADGFAGFVHRGDVFSLRSGTKNQ